MDTGMTQREKELKDLSTMAEDMLGDETFVSYFLAEAGERYDHETSEILLFIEVARQILAFAKCILDGHEWVDLSYGGPESGNIDMRCLRCGATVFTRLY